VTPPIVAMPRGSNPQGEEQAFRKEQIVVGDVVGLMRSFQRMSEALIGRLDKKEARVLTPPEGPPCAPFDTCRIHCELNKVKFPDFLVAMDCTTDEAWF
jgi:hypothetical protein